MLAPHRRKYDKIAREKNSVTNPNPNPNKMALFVQKKEWRS